jgi:hypothetical protein
LFHADGQTDGQRDMTKLIKLRQRLNFSGTEVRLCKGYGSESRG